MFTVFMVVLKLWKYVSVSSTASVATAVLIGVVVGFLDSEWSMAIYLVPLFLLVAWRHRSNFKNIKQGIEPKVSWI
jgi:glycerol-3-phosphate acyltransferase PlsY